MNTPASIAHLAHDAERLRMELLDALRREDTSQGIGGHTELVMLYGQAFSAVYEACIIQEPRKPVTIKVMHECVCGLAIYEVWKSSETPINASEDSERMAAHWRADGGALAKGDWDGAGG